ncbi:hypothetical protein KAW64_14780 [bacterium]|nr:hypothetical protein [bacterium]
MFEQLAQDSTSGASATMRAAALEMARMAETSKAPDPGEFWEELTAACTELISVKREMAPVINFAGEVLSSTQRVILSGLGTEALRGTVAMASERAIERSEMATESVGRKGCGLVEDGVTVATLSTSECVLEVLKQARESGRKFRVLLSESRPALEGVEQARRMAALGIEVVLVVDAALPHRISESGLVLVGADSVTSKEIVCKIGAYPLALAAREYDVPMVAVAPLDRFIPEALAVSQSRLADPNQILSDAPAHLTVENGYFEPVPLDFVRSVVTEKGIFDREEVEEQLRIRPVAPALLQILFPR